MVEHVLAKDETGVRFSLAAQNMMSFCFTLSGNGSMETGDNYVGNVHKGHNG